MSEFVAQNALIGFKEQIEKFKDFPKILRKHLRPTMVEITNTAKSLVISGAPTITGRYKGSIKSTVSASRTVVGSVTGRVKSTYHGHLVEEGRKPGKCPKPGSVLNLITWGGTPQEEWRQAFAMARWIGRHGTQGWHLFKKAFDSVKGSVPAKFEAALGRILAEMQNGR
jgi:hypothetical protein